ncbi:MAG TPA: heparan-alpha-glucosaminide N-acetyltransferase domain-containing protein [Verrucomicrobiae bacterium]|nr:heparan-alpha-glucosaminide N-acetyltransferase domain-containing protein [Verrucomicrobiae bacterium]
MNASPCAPSAGPRMRLFALDWLRGVAVLVMVECHVFNALLAAEHRSTRWFAALNWLNGLVAPAFLFVSGGVIGYNLQNRWPDIVSFGAAWRRLWRRIGQIFIVAYLLHLPTPLFWQFFGPRGPHLVALWTKMDILQCVFGSLAILLLLVPLTRAPRPHALVCLALGVLAATSVSAVGRWAPAVSAPGWLMDYLWPTGVGKFPLVPWIAFPALGVWLGRSIFSQSSMMVQCARSLLAGVVFLSVAPFVTDAEPYGAGFVFERMGWVLVGLAACCWIQKPARGTRWVLEFGQLSLWSYTVHLIIVYGSAITLGLDSLPRLVTWLVRLRQPDAPAVTGFSVPVTLFWLAAVLVVTGYVVRWRAKSLQRKAK